MVKRNRNPLEAVIGALPFEGRSYVRNCYMVGHLAARRGETVKGNFAARQLDRHANASWPVLTFGIGQTALNAGAIAMEANPALGYTGLAAASIFTMGIGIVALNQKLIARGIRRAVTEAAPPTPSTEDSPQDEMALEELHEQWEDALSSALQPTRHEKLFTKISSGVLATVAGGALGGAAVELFVLPHI